MTPIVLNEPDVKELCATAVTVGGVPAARLYVQEKQINLRVPFNVPTGGVAPFVVSREGHASPTVPVRSAPYLAAITPSGMAYVGLFKLSIERLGPMMCRSACIQRPISCMWLTGSFRSCL
jgi:uncharacterized protein (TIGR03437 family)